MYNQIKNKIIFEYPYIIKFNNISLTSPIIPLTNIALLKYKFMSYWYIGDSSTVKTLCIC